MNFFFRLFFLILTAHAGASHYNNGEGRQAVIGSDAVTEEVTFGSNKVKQDVVTFLADPPDLGEALKPLFILNDEVDKSIASLIEKYDRMIKDQLQLKSILDSLRENDVEKDNVIQTCKLRMSLPHGLGIQKIRERSNAGASSTGNSKCNAAGAFRSFPPGMANLTGVRLINDIDSDSDSAGRVEVYYGGKWGTVCDDHPIDGYSGHANNNAANVICRMLGFEYGEAKNEAFFGRGSGKIWLDDVNCSGDEKSLSDCPHRASGWGSNDCTHDEDLGVICHGAADPGFPWCSETLPASVWYRFDEKFSLRKISFTSVRLWGSTPETFEVIASNDCRDPWDVLKTIEAAGFTGSNQTRSWEIPCEDQSEYYCYGIRTTKVACGKPNEEGCYDTVNTFVSITNITMYS